MPGERGSSPAPGQGFWRHVHGLFIARAKVLASVVVDALLLVSVASVSLVAGKFVHSLDLDGVDLLVVRALQTIFATLTIGITLAMLARDVVAAFAKDRKDTDD